MSLFMLFHETPLPVFQFSCLSQFSFLKHAVFTRKGGHSQGAYSSLNLSFDVGDNPEAVKKNLELVKTYMGAKRIVWSRQIHDKNILIVQDDTLPPFKGYDAFITSCSYTALLVKLADCQGILLCDPERRVIAAIHCGWRGNVCNIIGATIEEMQDKFGSAPSDIWAGISPSLGPCCGEIKDYKTLLPVSLWPYKIKEHCFDWWVISHDQLVATGVPSNHIEIAHICTVCDKRFFSYRRDRKKTGRFGAVIMLTNKK
ncbi:peptidoglycan editing factor PgeF [Candidatus Desulfofervidus auxilii]|nr:peptidoglycan editing factor PgeF [Candidatus Desulfofervidus auxilii]